MQSFLGSLEKSQEILPYLKHLSKLLPSLLFEIGRVKEALEKILHIKKFAENLTIEL
jgi:hypothetical protein